MLKPKLYLLMAANRQRFKIGVSLDPARRWKSLGEAFIERESTVYSLPDAYGAEAILHSTFAQFRVTIEQTCVNGSSEWYSTECLQSAKVSALVMLVEAAGIAAAIDRSRELRELLSLFRHCGAFSPVAEA